MDINIMWVVVGVISLMGVMMLITDRLLDKKDELLLEKESQIETLIRQKLEQQGRIEELTKLANEDPLTGLMNRRAFEKVFSSLWGLLPRKGDPRHSGESDPRHNGMIEGKLGVMMIDADFFKKINDTYGHPVGDEVLQVLARTFKKLFRATDMISRWGGEEFAILIPNVSPESARALAEKIRRAVAKTKFSIPELTITVSIGVAVAEFRDDDLDLIKQVDEALYEAKENGRNQVVYREVHSDGDVSDTDISILLEEGEFKDP